MIFVFTIGSLHWSSQPPIKRETGYSNVLVFPCTVPTHCDLHYAWVFDEVAPIYRATVLKAWRHLIRSRATELIKKQSKAQCRYFNVAVSQNLPFTLQIISWLFFPRASLENHLLVAFEDKVALAAIPGSDNCFFHFAPFTPRPPSNHLLLMTKGLSD